MITAVIIKRVGLTTLRSIAEIILWSIFAYIWFSIFSDIFDKSPAEEVVATSVILALVFTGLYNIVKGHWIGTTTL